jgi:hypothetical protein
VKAWFQSLLSNSTCTALHPGSYGGITKFSVCNTPRPGTGSKVWHGLIEFADERHLAEFGCTADGEPFAHVHCLSPHARFCSLGGGAVQLQSSCDL